MGLRQDVTWISISSALAASSKQASKIDQRFDSMALSASKADQVHIRILEVNLKVVASTPWSMFDAKHWSTFGAG